MKLTGPDPKLSIKFHQKLRAMSFHALVMASLTHERTLFSNAW